MLTWSVVFVNENENLNQNAAEDKNVIYKKKQNNGRRRDIKNRTRLEQKR